GCRRSQADVGDAPRARVADQVRLAAERSDRATPPRGAAARADPAPLRDRGLACLDRRGERDVKGAAVFVLDVGGRDGRDYVRRYTRLVSPAHARLTQLGTHRREVAGSCGQARHRAWIGARSRGGLCAVASVPPTEWS